MKENQEKLLAYIFGVAFVTTLLIIAVLIPEPTKFQYEVFKIILAIACAGVAVFIPGMIYVQLSKVGKASGTLAVFFLVYFFSPAQLVIKPPLKVVEIKLFENRDIHLGDNIYPESMGYNHVPVNPAIYPQPNEDIIYFDKAIKDFLTIDGKPTIIGYEFLSKYAPMIQKLDFSAFSRISALDDNNEIDINTIKQKGNGDRFFELGPTFLYENKDGNGNFYEQLAAIAVIHPFHLKSDLIANKINKIKSADIVINAYHGGIRPKQKQNFYIYLNGKSYEVPASRDWPRKVEEIYIRIDPKDLRKNDSNVMAIYVLPWIEKFPKFISPHSGQLISPVHFRDIGIISAKLQIKS